MNKIIKILTFLLTGMGQLYAGAIFREAKTFLKDDVQQEAVTVATKEFSDIEIMRLVLEYNNRLRFGGFITELDNQIFALPTDLSTRAQNEIKKDIAYFIQRDGFFVSKVPLSPWLVQYFNRYLLPFSNDSQSLLQGYVASKLGYIYVGRELPRVMAFVLNRLPAVYVSDLEQGVFPQWFNELVLSENDKDTIKNAVKNILRKKIQDSGKGYVRLKIGYVPDWLSSEFQNYTDVLVENEWKLSLEYKNYTANERLAYFYRYDVNSDFVASQRDGYIYVDKTAAVAHNFLNFEKERIQEIFKIGLKLKEITDPATLSSDIRFIIISGHEMNLNRIAIDALFTNDLERVLVVHFETYNIPDDFKIPNSVKKIFIIGRNIKSVGSGFLADCSSLVSIQLPLGLTRMIGKTQFEVASRFLAGCSNLANLQLPSGLTQAGSDFLSGCTNLVSLQLPLGLTQIENNFLDNCRNLVNLQLPVGLIRISDFFLERCINLKNLELPSGLNQVGDMFLSGCGFRVLHLPVGLARIGSFFLYNCSHLIDLQLSPNLMSVGDWFLAYCGNLKDLRLPLGLIQVGDHFLDHCNNLKTLRIGRNFPQSVVDKVKQRIPQLRIIGESAESQPTAYHGEGCAIC